MGSIYVDEEPVRCGCVNNGHKELYLHDSKFYDNISTTM